MRLPRDLSGRELVKRLELFGYEVTRQKGSHMRLTTAQGGEHHVTVPSHDSLRLGTVRSILSAVANHLGITLDELAERLFSKS